ncbi:hypothetical protein RRG08_066771 [Elysia crispata]|uniref:Uncharacterized protein n=1 Tax=Elysia crispata TaxID=231223 RepID=A0AAE0XPD4_9GAST|nr:hypothetical protein RRG08_066771 [Elysia crispata]
MSTSDLFRLQIPAWCSFFCRLAVRPKMRGEEVKYAVRKCCGYRHGQPPWGLGFAVGRDTNQFGSQFVAISVNLHD